MSRKFQNFVPVLSLDGLEFLEALENLAHLDRPENQTKTYNNYVW